jgi:hypothetical protein
MSNRLVSALSICVLVAVGSGLAQAQAPAAQTPTLNIAGDWTGNWSSYNPAKGAESSKELCAKLDAKVAAGKDGVWEATFTGDCGRPYKYTIKMEGRQVGKVVLFKGMADLGPKDGGVYDWIGRATDQEFVGFFTSAGYTGVFNLSKAKPSK